MSVDLKLLIVKQMAEKHGPDAREDMRRLGIWVQVKCLKPDSARAAQEIAAIQEKYMDSAEDVNDYVYLVRDNHEYNVREGKYVDGTGRTYIVWCLNSIGVRWRDA